MAIQTTDEWLLHINMLFSDKDLKRKSIPE